MHRLITEPTYTSTLTLKSPGSIVKRERNRVDPKTGLPIGKQGRPQNEVDQLGLKISRTIVFSSHHLGIDSKVLQIEREKITEFAETRRTMFRM
jgi:hypothetical protein